MSTQDREKVFYVNVEATARLQRDLARASVRRMGLFSRVLIASPRARRAALYTAHILHILSGEVDA